MNILKKGFDYLRDPKKLLYSLDNKRIINLKDSTFLQYRYYYTFNKKLDLNNPKTFNEKLQWLKIYDRKKEYSLMVDKYEAKKYVSEIIGEEYIIPTIGVYNSWKDIDFEKLPSQFVIKCTHDSGGLIIVKDKDKLNIEEARKKINKSLNTNYYYSGREWPYKNVKPRIIIEKYMEDKQTKELRDYKFFCFNGRVECFKIDFDRQIEHHANYYDKEGNILKFGEESFPPCFEKKLSMPINLNKMISLAEKLSKGFPFLRVDFYEMNGKVYFGELTFYPASGFGKFTDEEWDRKLGDFIDLGLVKKNEK